MLSSFNSSSPPAYWSRLVERGWKSTRFRNYYTAGPFETQLYKYSVSSRWLLVHNDQRDESFFSKFYHRCCWVGERNVWRTAEFCIFHFVCTSEILIITISIIVSMTTFRKYFVYLWIILITKLCLWRLQFVWDGRRLFRTQQHHDPVSHRLWAVHCHHVQQLPAGCRQLADNSTSSAKSKSHFIRLLIKLYLFLKWLL